jgi:hypothetical protein
MTAKRKNTSAISKVEATVKIRKIGFVHYDSEFKDIPNPQFNNALLDETKVRIEGTEKFIFSKGFTKLSKEDQDFQTTQLNYYRAVEQFLMGGIR